jgi:hypothetical protein
VSDRDWYRHAGPRWWTRHTHAVAEHHTTFAIEVGDRAVASARSEAAAPWNWRQLFPQEPRGQGRLW